MAYLGVVARWDLFWADVIPAVGSEQGAERRPVLMVSNDGFHTNFPLVTVLSCTKAEGKTRTVYSSDVVLPKGMVTAQHASILMPQQIRTIARTRLVSRIGGSPISRYEQRSRIIYSNTSTSHSRRSAPSSRGGGRLRGHVDR